MGCRIDYSLDWATRATHEAQMHRQNSFVTLTFSDEFLPITGSIAKSDVQLFTERLRYHFPENNFSYMACGEYGEQLARPHYHAILFGLDFPDKKQETQKLYSSQKLQEIWPYGHSTIGEVNYKTAAYTARYSLKKVRGAEADEHYKKCNPQTGEVYDIEPEFLLTSRRPAIGKTWLEKYHTDLQKGFVTIEGKKRPIPKYYLRKYPQYDDVSASLLKSKREAMYDPYDPERASDRLRVKEKIKQSQINRLNRSLHQ